MRASDKNNHANLDSKHAFGVNFHDCIEQQDQSTMVELASDFGVTLGDIRKLKKRLHRS